MNQLPNALKTSVPDLVSRPLPMGGVVAGLVLFSRQSIVASVLVAFWRMTFGGVQVGWPTWLTRTLPAIAESGGGLQVATTQLAITTGAALGGMLFNLTGVVGVFIASSGLTLVAALVAWLAFRKAPAQVAVAQPAPTELVALKAASQLRTVCQ